MIILVAFLAFLGLTLTLAAIPVAALSDRLGLVVSLYLSGAGSAIMACILAAVNGIAGACT